MGEFDKVAQGPKTGINAIIVGNVIAVVFAGGGLERHQPDRRHAQSLQIVQAACQAQEVSHSVAIRIHERADRAAIDDCVLVPTLIEHVVAEPGYLRQAGSFFRSKSSNALIRPPRTSAEVSNMALNFGSSTFSMSSRRCVTVS